MTSSSSGAERRLEQGIPAPAYRLPASTRVGRVRFQVADLARSLAFYGEVLGLDLRQQAGGRAALGPADGSATLLELHERPGAAPVPPGGRLGLYHVAVLLPDRAALGSFAHHLMAARVPVGASDHRVSEAFYLSDPDGLGIEVYADRPHAAWQYRDRQVVMATEPLDAAGLLQAAEGMAWQGMPSGTTIGHVHLHVGDLEAAAAFYHRALGLDQVVWSYPGALFLSAGGYHHHLAVNTWARHARPAGAGDARLLEWELRVPTADDVQHAAASLREAGYPVELEEGAAVTHDPWGTGLRIRTAGP